MRIHGRQCVIRPYQESDVSSLTQFANNPNVWRNMLDLFPHPYSHAHAIDWVRHCTEGSGRETDFAIEAGGVFVGGIGCKVLRDVFRHTREIGYWLAEPYWGRGIATDAVQAWSAHLLALPDVERCEARVFGYNRGSARVLEKSGYTLEGRHARAVFKDGVFTDALIYGRLRA